MHRLDQIIAEKHLLTHPFYQRWVLGKLTLEELKRYAINYYPHVQAFPTYVSAVHSNCDDPETRQELLQNLREEEEGEENHPELWLRFAESLGVSRDEVKNSNKIQQAHRVVETFRKLAKRGFASGLGALYAYESQVPQIAEKKIEGLSQFYGIRDERGVKFFKVHQTADIYHSQTAREAIDQLSPAEQEEAYAAAKEAGEVLWDFLTALDREAGVEMVC